MGLRVLSWLSLCLFSMCLFKFLSEYVEHIECVCVYIGKTSVLP